MKNTTKLIVALMSVLVATVSLTPTSVHAAETNLPGYVVVTSSNGLNLRDKNCNVIETHSYGRILMIQSEAQDLTITCTVNGTSYKMTKVSGLTDSQSLVGYSALHFTAPIIVNTPENYPSELKGPKVTASDGLNIRDENCKKVAAVANNYKFEDFKAGYGGSIQLCTVNGKFYNMVPVIYNGKTYQVASAYVTYK